MRLSAATETARCTGHCCRTFILGGGLGVSPVELGQRVRDGVFSPLMRRWVTTALVYLGEHEHNPATGKRTESGRKAHWYTCRKLTEAGSCGDYVNRPWTCRDYPHGQPCEQTGCTRTVDAPKHEQQLVRKASALGVAVCD